MSARQWGHGYWKGVESVDEAVEEAYWNGVEDGRLRWSRQAWHWYFRHCRRVAFLHVWHWEDRYWWLRHVLRPIQVDDCRPWQATVTVLGFTWFFE